MRAKIQYTDCLGDSRKVHYILSINNVPIIKEREGMSIYPIITIEYPNEKFLNDLMAYLNKETYYGVKLRKRYKPLGEKLWNLFFVGLR